MRNYLAVSLLTLMMSVAALAQQSSPATPSGSTDNRFSAMEFLVGTWQAEPGPDKVSSHFTFAYDVNGSVLVRRNHAEYPATATRPASKHDDLLVIFRDPETKSLKADYWDNEDHVIHYTVSPTADGIDFVSDAQQASPGFRLRYRKLGVDSVAIDFEIAPPGKPGAFSRYLSGTAHRTSPAK